jgi:anti-sigma regulatory factor (Ser/Thr protein kinase)
MRTESATRTQQRGVAIVEYVVALPICLLLILGTAEFGRALLQYNALTQSVQDGARYLSSRALLGTTGVVDITPQLEEEVRNQIVYGNRLGTGNPRLPGFDPADVTVTDEGFGIVRVEASYEYDAMFAFVPFIVTGGGVSLAGRTFQTAVAMRAL